METKVIKETKQEDWKEEDKKDGDSVEEVHEEELVSTIPQQKLLFNIPVDEQIFKLSTDPRSGKKGDTKKRIHRYGTKWLQLQKSPTVRAKIERKLKTEVRVENDEEEDKQNGQTKYGELAFQEDEERREIPEKDLQTGSEVLTNK